MGTLLLTKLFLAASIKYGIPPNLLSSLCYVESGHKITAYHRDDGKGNSVGICQIKIGTARMLGFKGTEKQLMIPQNNIRYAAMYLQHQIKRYNGDVIKAIISYNQGSAKNLLMTNYCVKVIKQWRIKNEIFTR